VRDATAINTTHLLPAPLGARSETGVAFYEVELESRSASATAFDNQAAPMGTVEAEQSDDGQFRLRCVRGAHSVAISFSVRYEHERPVIDGDIDGQHFHIANETGTSFALTDVQKNVLKPWNAAGEPLIGLGEAVALHSTTQSILGCVAAGLGTGIAAAACLEGALPACAAGLYGVAYLADHCI
jgi:hypothetical protein